MFLIALSLLAGVLCLNMLTQLPGISIYITCFLSIAACVIVRRNTSAIYCRALAMFLIGMSWAQWHASNYLDRVLPENFAGKDISISGIIADIPATDDSVQRFIVQVEEFIAAGYIASPPERIRLSWYYGKPVRAGELWQFDVRLKPPHGFMNPGGFDYEAWLYHNGIHATGYVRNSEHNRKTGTAAWFDSDVLRQRIAEFIAHMRHDSAFAGLIVALAVGDRSDIQAAQWQALINTGTNHLMAISGLHIGLAAAFGYALCRRLLPSSVMHTLPAQHAAMIAALIMAFIYATLAGFAIPTQRALLMLACVVGASLCRRLTRPRDVLALALAAVILWDPAAVMSAGFWFSFLAVAAIFYVMEAGAQQSLWLKWGWLQFVIALALLPLSLFLFQQTSLVAPLANLIMVPYVSLLVVPLVLLAIALLPVSDTAATLLFQLAEKLFSLIWPLLQWLSELPFSVLMKAQPGMLMTLLALAGVVILLTPRLGYVRTVGALLMLPALIWQPRPPVPGAYELNILDVGQGLAIVVRTHRHTLVYDTGARFSDRLDSGTAVLRPFLVHEGIRQIDLLMISHGDGDHIGGAASLLEAYPQTPVLGRGTEALNAASSRPCHAGQQWVWDDVEFTLLHPDTATYPASNNRSCVLRIAGRGGTALLTGDIERQIETRMLRRGADALAADILVAPHHGSKSSSSIDFIDAIAPQQVIFAAGYRNRYGFPMREIVARYGHAGADMHISGHAGALRIQVHPEHGIGPVERYRDSRGKYWNHRLARLRHAG
jgi:competence protein ComEC